MASSTVSSIVILIAVISLYLSTGTLTTLMTKALKETEIPVISVPEWRKGGTLSDTQQGLSPGEYRKLYKHTEYERLKKVRMENGARKKERKESKLQFFNHDIIFVNLFMFAEAICFVVFLVQWFCCGKKAQAAEWETEWEAKLDAYVACDAEEKIKSIIVDEQVALVDQEQNDENSEKKERRRSTGNIAETAGADSSSDEENIDDPDAGENRHLLATSNAKGPRRRRCTESTAVAKNENTGTISNQQQEDDDHVEGVITKDFVMFSVPKKKTDDTANDDDTAKATTPNTETRAALAQQLEATLTKEERKCRSPWVRELFWFTLSGTADWFGMGLQLAGLSLIPPSVAQMVKAARVLFVGLLSWFFLKKNFYKHHVIGLVVLSVGVALISLGCILTERDSKTLQDYISERKLIEGKDTKDQSFDPSAIFGMLLCLAGVGFSAANYVAQEVGIRRAPQVPTILAIGTEGISGLALGLIILGVGEATELENTKWFLHQTANSWHIQLLIPTFFLCSIGQNVSGMLISKQVSALARTVLECGRTLLIFNIEPLIVNASASYREKYNPLQPSTYILPLGYVIAILGSLLFFNMVVVSKSWLGEEEIRELEAKKKEAEGEVEEEEQE